MKDQHTKIKGYRDLSQYEIDLMNKAKAHAEITKSLIEELEVLRDPPSSVTVEQHCESLRCLGLAKEYLQTGQMWLVRAIALPNSF